MSTLAKTPFLLLTLGLLLATAMPASATTATVTLKVHASITFPFNEPAFTTDGLTTCSISVDAGDDAGDVLDQAVTNGCIDGWDYDLFGSSRFLTEIEGHGEGSPTHQRNTFTAWPCMFDPIPPENGEIVASSWVFLVNGIAGTVGSTVGGTAVGIDGYSAASGDVLEFVYVVDTCAFANALAVGLTGVHVDSPVLLPGNALTDPGNL